MCNNLPLCLYLGISSAHRNFLFISSILLVIFSLASLVVDVSSLIFRFRCKEILDILRKRIDRLMLEIPLTVCVIVFVIGYYLKDTRNWCAHNYQWNFGAIITCLSWITMLITLRAIPVLSEHIDKLFLIIKQFMTICILPILLIIAFFLPFSMLFTPPWPVSIFYVFA